MPYVDPNVFIYPILYEQEQEPRVKRATETLHGIEKGLIPAYTSTLTWDEVVWIVRKNMGKDEAASQGQKLIGFLNLRWIPVDENILNQAQALMNKYSLHPRDAIHAASAINKKIAAIISDDKDYDAVKEIERIPL